MMEEMILVQSSTLGPVGQPVDEVSDRLGNYECCYGGEQDAQDHQVLPLFLFCVLFLSSSRTFVGHFFGGMHM